MAAQPAKGLPDEIRRKAHRATAFSARPGSTRFYAAMHAFEAVITIQRRKKMASAPHRLRMGKLAARFVRPAASAFLGAFIGLAALLPSASLADGIPMPGQIGFQEAASPN